LNLLFQSYPCSSCGRGVRRRLSYGVCLLSFSVHLLVLEVIFLLKLHDGILVTLFEFFCFPGQRITHFPKQCIICIQHKIVIFSHVSIMFALCKKHVWVLVVTTMHVFFKPLIEILIHVVALEWRPCLLVALISPLPLFPLSDLRNFTHFENLIPGLGVMLFSGSGYVSHIHFFH
jgi:hypothetical protein